MEPAALYNVLAWYFSTPCATIGACNKKFRLPKTLLSVVLYV